MHPIVATTLGAAALATSGGSAAADTHPAWTVVRVTVSQTGDLEAMGVAYHSGDPEFDRTALRLVANTTFAPAWRRTGPATLDYAIVRDANGERDWILPAPTAPLTVAWKASRER